MSQVTLKTTYSFTAIEHEATVYEQSQDPSPAVRMGAQDAEAACRFQKNAPTYVRLLIERIRELERQVNARGAYDR